ncbi:alpha/beta-hydrolase [Serendipita vermifera]|nr:alpha/beta-hydrolase [Serendipita vermifera]
MPMGESEDCLSLNIWTSKSQTNSTRDYKKGRPVAVIIHGGGWVIGSSADPLNDFTKWVDDHPEIIIVSINYRLHFFGYPPTPAIPPEETNAGLRDQFLAIEWVHKNIAAFGGDPNRLILAGQSAGAASTAGYLYSHPKDPLISGAIIMSGNVHFMSGALLYFFVPGVVDIREPFQGVATVAGCALDGEKWKAQLKCLRDKSTEELKSALKSDGVMPMLPFPDSRIVFTESEYKSKGRAGKFAKVPILTGVTDNEADFMAVDYATNTLNETLSDHYTQAVWTCYDGQQANFSVAANSPTYRYRYMPRFPAISVPPLRASHTSDIPILVGIIDGAVAGAPPPTEIEMSASVYMQKAWSAFITDPVHGLVRLGWPPYNSQGATLVELFPNNNVQNPILLEKPQRFDSGCLALGV